MTHPSMMTIDRNQNSSYAPTPNNNNYFGQIDQFSQAVNNGGSYMSIAIGDIRNNNNNSLSQWSTGNNAGLSLVSGNNGVCGTLGNSVSSLSSVYQQNQSQSMYNPNGLNQQTSYPHTNDRKRLQSSCGLPSSSKRTGYAYESGYRSSSTMIPPNYIQSFNGSSSSQSTRNIYGSEYPSSSKTIHPNDIQSSSSVCNQYATANLADGHNQTNCDPYYSNLLAQQYYPQQQPTAAVSAINQPQTQIPVDQTIAPNRFTTSSDVGLDKNYQHLPR